MGLKFYPGTKSAVYNDRQKWPRYNGPQSPLTLSRSDGGKLLALRLRNFSREDHFKAAAHYKREHTRLQRAWSKAADDAAKRAWNRKFQFHDYRISGIGSDEFSESDKNKLRRYAVDQGIAAGAAYAHAQAGPYAKRYGFGNGVLKNPRKRGITVIAAQVFENGAWKTIAEFSSDKFHDPRGQAFGAAKVFARIERKRVRVIKK